MIIDGFLVYFFFTFKPMFFARDIFPALTFLFFMLQEPFRDALNELGRELGILVFFSMAALLTVGILQIYNPESPGLIRGLLGIKLMFLPWLLIPLSYVYFTDIETVENFFKKILIFSIPVNTIGLLQFFLGPGFMIATFGPGFANNTQLAHIYSADYTGASFVRIAGTFASSALYGQFLVFIVIICFVLLYAETKPRWLWLLIMAQNLFCILGTGSRGALLFLVLMFISFSFMLKRARSVIFGLVLFSATLFAAFLTLGPAVTARFEDAARISGIRARTVETTSKMFMMILDRYPLGKGIGSASQASRHLGKIQGEYELVENYQSKLQMEVGIVGVILFYALMVFIFARWVEWRGQFFEDTKSHLFFCALSAYFGACVVVGVFPDTAPASVFFWSCVGLLPRLAQFGRMELYEQRNLPRYSA